jgi:O-antigen ligase
MRSRSSRRRRTKTIRQSIGPGMLLTALLLAILLMAGPLLLGGARLWVALPLLAGAGFLLALQGLRLAVPVRADVPRSTDAIDLGIALFVLYTLVRWLTSPIEYVSRIEAMEVTAYAGIFWTCRYGLANRWCCMMLMYLLVLLGVGETIFGYVLSQHSDPANPATQWFPFGPTETLHLLNFPRWQGTYESPNHYVSLLIMALAAALALGSFSKLAWPVRIVFFYLGALLMVGVVFAASRGSLFAFPAAIAGLAVLGIRHGTMRWWVPAVGAGGLIAAATLIFFLTPMAQYRMAQAEGMVTHGNLDQYGRVQLTRDAFRIVRDHPLWGTGPGTFIYVHPHYETGAMNWGSVLTHNDYLNCAADYGLVGFALAMFFVGAVTFKFFRPLWIDNRWQDRVLVATGFSVWAALLVHSWVDFNLHIPANAMLFFALIGLAMGRIKKDPMPHWGDISWMRPGRGLGWGIVVFSLAFAALAIHMAVGDIIYEQAAARADSVPFSDSIAAIEQSLSYDGDDGQALLSLGNLYREKAALQTNPVDKKDYAQKALDTYRRALQVNPLDDDAEAGMGQTYDVVADYPAALACYQKAVAARPHYGLFWMLAGREFEQLGQFPQAEEAYLLEAKCPEPPKGFYTERDRVRRRPEMKDVPAPAPGTNPFKTGP